MLSCIFVVFVSIVAAFCADEVGRSRAPDNIIYGVIACVCFAVAAAVVISQ